MTPPQFRRKLAFVMPDGFVTKRDRDAWAVIRGFVYQVDLTITRWLELQTGEILELERGEDIDLIGKSLAAGLETDKRLLEQIKHRTQPVSLRTASVITAVACAVEHRNANPKLKLEFRFTTNAPITVERVSLIDPSGPGITMWEEIRQGQLSPSIQTNYLSQIRTILKSIERPSALNIQTWKAFQEFILRSADDELLDLIRCYEWSTGERSGEQLSGHVQQSLISLGHAHNESVAVEQYQRLFLHVFKVLSCPDIKRLTRADLITHLSLPTLNDADRSLLTTLADQIGKLENRMGVLEEGLAETNAAMEQIQNTVAAAMGDPDMKSGVDFLVAHPILEPPPLVNQLSHRVEVVNQFSNQLRQHTWLAIHGGAGIGKTQLALLLTKHCGNCRAWVRFRDLNPDQSYARLIKAYETLTDCPFDLKKADWSKFVCTSPGLDTLLVLDDLPRINGSEEIADCLVALATACQASGIRLLSTSHWALSQRVIDVLPKQLFIGVESPLLNEDEAKEILVVYGAPTEMLNDKFVRFVNGLARKHPALLVAIARFLAQRKWQTTEKNLIDLIKGQHTKEVMDETVGRLLKTVEDKDSREMLFRLNLVWGSFSQNDINILANIKPVVSRANEKLHNLTGLWIQRDIQDTFSVSPLVRTLQEGFLNEQTRHDCHDALGRRLLKKRTVDPNEIWEAFGHYFSAKEFGRAGGVLMIAFNSLSRLRSLSDHRGLLDVWIDQPMPEDFELAMRIYLRALQISTRAKFSKENAYLLGDLDKLIEKAQSNEGWAVLAAAVSLNRALAKQDPVRANKYMLRALTLCPRLTGPTGEMLEFPKGLGPEFFFWTTSSAIRNKNDLHDWLSTVEQLTPKQRDNLFNSRHGPDGCLALAERLWNEEAKKPVEKQNWDVVLQGLDDLEMWATKFNLRLLQACATRAKMVVLAERKHDLNSITALASPFLSGPDPDPRVRFVVKEMIGRQYRHAGKNDEALKWLDAALVEPIDDFDFEQIEAMLNASFAIGDRDPRKAVLYAENATAKARSSEGAARMYVIALAELAIAKWIAGYEWAQIFIIWEEAAEKLISIKNKNDSWKALYMAFGHCSGYFAHLADRGKPPETTSEGEPYSIPTRRMFFSYNPEFAKLYDSAKDILLPAQLAMFASGAKLDDKAAAWALRSIDTTRKLKQLQVLPVFGFILIPHLLNADQYSNALDLALEASAILRASYMYHQQRGGGTFPLGPEILNIDSIFGVRPNDSWRQVESDSLSVGILPTVLRINTVALVNRKAAALFAGEVQATCRKIAASASNPSLWEDLAQLFGQFYVDRVPGKELVKRGNQYENQTLMNVSYLGACIQDDINHKTSCTIQLAAMPFVHSVMQGPRSAYRQIAVPFILEYWKSAFVNARFEFSTPSIVEQELTVAYQVAKDKQPQAILRAVSNGLGISPSEQQRKWLQG